MTADAGMAQIFARMRGQFGSSGNGASKSDMPDGDGPAETDLAAGLSIGVAAQIAATLGQINREMADRRRFDQMLSQAVTIIDLPPQDYVLSGGAPKFKADKASAADVSPQEGYWWFVTRATVSGLTAAGDAPILNKGTGILIASGAMLSTLTSQIDQFPVSTATKSVSSIYPGTQGIVLRPDDALFLSGSGLTSTEFMLTGQAAQVELRLVAKYLF